MYEQNPSVQGVRGKTGEFGAAEVNILEQCMRKTTALKDMFCAILIMKHMQIGLSTKQFANLHKCQRKKSGQK